MAIRRPLIVKCEAGVNAGTIALFAAISGRLGVPVPGCCRSVMQECDAGKRRGNAMEDT